MNEAAETAIIKSKKEDEDETMRRSDSLLNELEFIDYYFCRKKGDIAAAAATVAVVAAV